MQRKNQSEMLYQLAIATNEISKMNQLFKIELEEYRNTSDDEIKKIKIKEMREKIQVIDNDLEIIESLKESDQLINKETKTFDIEKMKNSNQTMHDVLNVLEEQLKLTHEYINNMEQLLGRKFNSQEIGLVKVYLEQHIDTLISIDHTRKISNAMINDPETPQKLKNISLNNIKMSEFFLLQQIDRYLKINLKSYKTPESVEKIESDLQKIALENLAGKPADKISKHQKHKILKEAKQVVKSLIGENSFTHFKSKKPDTKQTLVTNHNNEEYKSGEYRNSRK